MLTQPSPETSHLLIVDDDQELAGMLCRYLQQQGFQAEQVGSGQSLDTWLATRQTDLIVLDLMLPGEDGLSIARRLQNRVPFIMISARGEEIDRIVGLEMGADDYLAKPFNPRELVARIRAVLRRNAGDPARQRNERMTFGPYELDLDSHTLWRQGERCVLTTAEFTLLKILAQNPNRVLSREELVTLAEGAERLPYDRSIDVRITRLRKKIEPNPDQPLFIRTVWGAGYLFSPRGATP